MIIDLKLLVAAVTVGLVLGNESCSSMKSNKVIDTTKEEIEVGDIKQEEKKGLVSTKARDEEEKEIVDEEDEEGELAEVVIEEGTEVIEENELSANLTNAVKKYKGEFTKLSNVASNLDFGNLRGQFRKPIREELTNIGASIKAILGTEEAKASPQKDTITIPSKKAAGFIKKITGCLSRIGKSGQDNDAEKKKMIEHVEKLNKRVERIITLSKIRTKVES